jgi:Restriction endonuclease
MSDPRGAWTVESLKDVGLYGSVITEPSYHLTRFAASFSSDDRVKLLKTAISMQIHSDGKGSNEQHVAFVLAEGDDPSVMTIDGMMVGKPSEINVGLSPLSEMYRAVCRGADSYHFAKFLVNTVFVGSFPQNQEINSLLNITFGHTVLSAEQAVLLHTCISTGLAQVVYFEEEAASQLEDAKLVPRKSFTSSEHQKVQTEQVLLQAVLNVAVRLREQHLEGQIAGLKLDETLFNHGIILDGKSSILEPYRKPKIIIAKTISEAERVARGGRDAVLEQSPRQFEEFCADLFRRLGWEVELTKASRDGGVDLLLLRSLTGVPVRWGVEIKRYKDSPITVNHVRSFYGANQIHKANQLVYITTSRYTKPAIDFSNACSPVTLDLKTFSHLQEWAKDAYG